MVSISVLGVKQEMENPDPEWKLKLRYGKTKTEFKHFTAMADGVVSELTDGYECPKGRAWMAMKTWAVDADESSNMIRVIGERIGFSTDGEIMIYDTEPNEPPRDRPFGYGITFTPYDKKA